MNAQVEAIWDTLLAGEAVQFPNGDVAVPYGDPVACDHCGGTGKNKDFNGINDEMCERCLGRGRTPSFKTVPYAEGLASGMLRVVPAAPLSMLDAIRRAVETGDALRPACWGPGFYLVISPRPLGTSFARGKLKDSGLSSARLRNPATRADHPLDIEEMLGPWVTLTIQQAQTEAATRAADGEEVH